MPGVDVCIKNRFHPQRRFAPDSFPGEGFNCHLHVIATDGCFYGNGSFKICPTSNPKDLEGLFRYEVFKMLKAEGKITEVIVQTRAFCYVHQPFKHLKCL